MIDALHKVLKLLWIAVLPGFIWRGVTPSLFGADLLRDVYVSKNLFSWIERFQSVDGIQIAAGAVIVAGHFEPVMNPSYYEFG